MHPSTISCVNNGFNMLFFSLFVTLYLNYGVGMGGLSWYCGCSVSALLRPLLHIISEEIMEEVKASGLKTVVGVR